MIFLATIQQLSEWGQRFSRGYTRFSDYQRLSRKNWATISDFRSDYDTQTDTQGTARDCAETYAETAAEPRGNLTETRERAGMATRIQRSRPDRTRTHSAPQRPGTARKRATV